jgi:hypothetical protein
MERIGIEDCFAEDRRNILEAFVWQVLQKPSSAGLTTLTDDLEYLLDESGIQDPQFLNFVFEMRERLMPHKDTSDINWKEYTCKEKGALIVVDLPPRPFTISLSQGKASLFQCLLLAKGRPVEASSLFDYMGTGLKNPGSVLRTQICAINEHYLKAQLEAFGSFLYPGIFQNSEVGYQIISHQ